LAQTDPTVDDAGHIGDVTSTDIVFDATAGQRRAVFNKYGA
jgi:hypothetical protein